MNPAWWSVALVGVGGTLTWCTFVARLLWMFRGKWDETNSTLQGVKDQIQNLSEHDRRIEHRLDEHLAWHDRH